MVFIPLAKAAEMASSSSDGVSGGDPWARALLLQSIDHIIELGRQFKYVWPLRYHPHNKPVTVPGGSGEERSDVYGYLYLMMKCYQLTGNQTFLTEAIAAHDTPDALHRAEFMNLYEVGVQSCDYVCSAVDSDPLETR